MAIQITPVTAANANFGPLGSAAWAAGMKLTGATSGRVLTNDGTNITDSANLTFGDTQLAAGPGIAIGTGGTTSAGWSIGYGGATGQSGIWPTSVTPSGSNFSLLATSTQTTLNGLSNVFIATAGGTKATFDTNAGSGPSFTMGTATTDVGLRATQTWNNGAVAFTHEKHLITDTASAAGSLAVAYYGGASASTILFSVDKSGVLQFGTTYSAGVVTATGTIQVKDATGTTYNVLVHT